MKLKNVKTEIVEGEEKIWSQFPKSSEYGFFSAKHTYLKCNACGKQFSLNYKDKKFEEAKLAALKAKWEHQETENHHQEEVLYFGEVEVEESE